MKSEHLWPILKLYCGICLERLGGITENVHQNSCSLTRTQPTICYHYCCKWF